MTVCSTINEEDLFEDAPNISDKVKKSIEITKPDGEDDVIRDLRYCISLLEHIKEYGGCGQSIDISIKISGSCNNKTIKYHRKRCY